MKIILPLLSLINILSSNLRAKEAIPIIEAFGDSITAGYISFTSTVIPLPEPVFTQILTDELQFQSGEITFKQLRDALERKHHSWPEKLLELEKDFPQEIRPQEVKNYAVSRATSSQLLSQVEKSDPDVTSQSYFWMGNNDLINSEVQDFDKKIYENYYESLSLWDKKHLNSQAFILPLGNIYKVFSTLQNEKWGIILHQDAPHPKLVRYSCQNSWSHFFLYCLTFLDKFNVTNNDGQNELQVFFENRNIKFIQSIDKLIQIFNKETQHNNHYYFLKNFAEVQYKKDDFAVDCFHPSEKGQERISQVVNGLVRKILGIKTIIKQQ